MKILELRFKNLNSLYGESFIDFTHEEYITDGIFALTGPTGSGKSTVLDAICLALYGATPRLGKITKSGNDIMSRQTGECFAEVLFESREGRFRCHWSQHRARKKAEGELQAPKHEIAEGVDGGKVIESKLRNVTKRVEEKTGMDFERFTRSVLLAQGGFDTFLKADIEEKSKILEQITGTGIYTQISILVHERNRSESEHLDRLVAEMGGIELLSDENKFNLKKELQEKSNEERAIAKNVESIENAIRWLGKIDQLKKDLTELDQQKKVLQEHVKKFEPQKVRLELAKKAVGLEAVYVEKKAAYEQRTSDEKALRQGKESLPILLEELARNEEQLKQVQQQLATANKNWEESQPIIRNVRAMDQEMDTLSERVKAMEDEYRKSENELQAMRKQLSNRQKKLAQAEKSFFDAAEYLKTHSADEWLLENLSGLEIRLRNLEDKQCSLNKSLSALKNGEANAKKLDSQLQKVTKQEEALRHQYESTVEQNKKGEDLLNKILNGRLLREYIAKKESLIREQGYLNTIASLEEHRAKLKDGEACPLCGATEHPYVSGNLPVANDMEIRISKIGKTIASIEKQMEENQKLAASMEVAKEKLDKLSRKRQDISVELKAIKDEIGKLRSTAESEQAEWTTLQKSLADEVERFEPSPDFSHPERLLEKLGERRQAWERWRDKQSSAEKDISAFASEIKLHKSHIGEAEEKLEQTKKQLFELRRAQTDKAKERIACYGNKNTDEEEKKLQEALKQAGKAVEDAVSMQHRTEQKVITKQEQIKDLEQRVQSTDEAMVLLNDRFNQALQQAGFRDEQSFLSARMEKEKLSTLETQARELTIRTTELNARQHDKQDALQGELARNITEKSLVDLYAELSGVQANLKAIREQVSRIKFRLEENEKALAKTMSKREKIEQQKSICEKWGNLHKLIGSADGKKYRNFAQGLTFELMIGHANRQLRKMSDRYLLTRDREQPLELNVIDNYQAGEIRSTRNLSGGESFIMSLTLALGLSQMASRNVRVDSLFLDEGFGTLDQEALDTALETLSGLHQEGKLIGVISHVAALRERIGTRIQVTPHPGGRSIISGPGCQQALHI